MSGFASVACRRCGRGHWAEDRFCGNCGLSFSDDEGGISDPTESVDPGLRSAGTSHRRREIGTGLLVVTILASIVGLVLWAGNRAAEDSTVAADELVDAAAQEDLVGSITEIPITLVPEPTAEVTPVTNPDWPAGLSGWLVRVGTDGFRVVNMETGIEHQGIQQTDSLFSPTGGMGSVGQFGVASFADAAFRPWNGDAAVPIPLRTDEFVAAVLDDPVAGPVVLIRRRSLISPLEQLVGAVRVNTGERQEIFLDPRNELGIGWFNHAASPLVTSAGDVLYRWTWDGGWEATTTGTLLAPFGQVFLIMRCETPETCALFFVDVDGDELSEAAYSIVNGGFPIVSPDLSRIAFGVDDSSLSASVTIVDLANATGLRTRVAVENPISRIHTWVGNDQILVSSNAGTLDLINVETAEATRLPWDELVQGNFENFVWFAQFESIDFGPNGNEVPPKGDS